jgi:DNA-binding CsgD family transcriptional regulator
MEATPGGCPLSAIELSAVELLAEGLAYKEIGARLNRSPSTIRTHLHHVYVKLGVSDRAQAVLAATRAGWIDSPDLDPYAQLTLRLARATEELCRAVRERSKLTGPQRAYLSAFDALLYARTDEDKIAAREGMQAALGVVLGDAGVPDRPRRQRDLVELLVGYADRFAEPRLRSAA